MDLDNINNVVNNIETAIQDGAGLEFDEKRAVVDWAEKLGEIYGLDPFDAAEFSLLIGQLINAE